MGEALQRRPFFQITTTAVGDSDIILDLRS